MKRHLSWPALAVLLVFLSGACGRDDAPGVTGISASAASGPSILRDVILFTTDELRPSSSQLAIIAPDGSGRRLLTNDEFRWREPAISPDGRRIAVSRSTSYDHTDGIYLMNADGSEPSLLIRHSAVFDGQPAWSPDGGQIAFMSSVEIGGFGPYGRIFVINVDGTGLRQLAEADGSESSLDEAPSWSPDGTRIVFTRNFMLHVINADGTGLIALPNEDFAVGATWSPDGRHIAYMSLDGSDIRMRNADGSNPVTVTAGGGPKWSPDSRRLVFSRIVGGRLQNFVINIDGTGERRLSFGGSDASPTWSPFPPGRSLPGVSIEISPTDAKLAPADTRQFTATVRGSSGNVIGNASVTWSSSDPAVATVTATGLVTASDNGAAQIRAAFGGDTARVQVRVVDRVLRNAIVYSTDEFGAPEFAVVKPDGTGRRRLTTDEIGYQSPDVAPDGTRIVFAKVFSIFVISADARGLTEGYTEVFTDFDAPPRVPVWSPDGAQIAFVAAGRVFVVNADGSGRRQVSPDDPASDDAPTWSPDGTRIIFTRNNGLQVINVDGTGLTALPNEDLSASPDWSPDGTRVAYGSPAGGIRIRNADGSNLLTVTTGQDSHPRWSPDSRRLVFARVVDGKSQLFTVKADGTGETRLSANPNASEDAPSWSPVP